MKFNINDLDLDSNIEVDRKKNERENVRNAKRNLEFRKKEVLKATYNQLKKLDEEIEKQEAKELELDEEIKKMEE